jgi:hypothetical protein
VTSYYTQKTSVFSFIPTRIEAFIEIAKPYGIVETARSGVVAMPRGIVSGPSLSFVHPAVHYTVADPTTFPPTLTQVVQPSTADADDAVDMSLLPPS